MLVPKIQMCFNEPDYVTVHSVRKMTANGAKIAQKNATIIFLNYCYVALVRKELLQSQNDKYGSLVKLLCIYLCYFIVLNMVNHCLAIFFSIIMSLERSRLDEVKKCIKSLKK